MATKKSDIQREDRPGHLDPKHAARLREQGGHAKDDDRAFVGKRRSSEDLSEELGEEAVRTMTSGEDATDALQQQTDDESGGPFVPSTEGVEMARGTDASNPRGAKREPFPKT